MSRWGSSILVSAAVLCASDAARACGNELVEGGDDLVALAVMAVVGVGAVAVASGVAVVVLFAVAWVAWGLVRTLALS